MGVWDQNFGSHGWSRDVDLSDYSEAAAAIAHETTGFRAVIEADLGDIFTWHTKIMWVGYSDGGGMGIYLQYFDGLKHVPSSGSWSDSNGLAGITNVIAIDYYASQDYVNWLGSYGNRMNAKIYMSCSSFTYSKGDMLFDIPASACSSGPPSGCESDAMPQKMWGAGYYFQPFTPRYYGNSEWKEWRWDRVSGHAQCGAIKWAVQGLTNGPPQTSFNGYPSGDAEWDNKCVNGSSHGQMFHEADVVGDIDDWIVAPARTHIRYNPCLAMIAAISKSALTSSYKLGDAMVALQPGRELKKAAAYKGNVVGKSLASAIENTPAIRASGGMERLPAEMKERMPEGLNQEGLTFREWVAGLEARTAQIDELTMASKRAWEMRGMPYRNYLPVYRQMMEEKIVKVEGVKVEKVGDPQPKQTPAYMCNDISNDIKDEVDLSGLSSLDNLGDDEINAVADYSLAGCEI